MTGHSSSREPGEVLMLTLKWQETTCGETQEESEGFHDHRSEMDTAGQTQAPGECAGK